MTSIACVLSGRPAAAAELSFADRVRAQVAIERIGYAHQIDTSRSFEEAVPRAVLEERVRTYLAQSAALERLWKRPITAEMLRGELERIAAGAKMPDVAWSPTTTASAPTARSGHTAVWTGPFPQAPRAPHGTAPPSTTAYTFAWKGEAGAISDNVYSGDLAEPASSSYGSCYRKQLTRHSMRTRLRGQGGSTWPRRFTRIGRGVSAIAPTIPSGLSRPHAPEAGPAEGGGEFQSRHAGLPGIRFA